MINKARYGVSNAPEMPRPDHHGEDNSKGSTCVSTLHYILLENEAVRKTGGRHAQPWPPPHPSESWQKHQLTSINLPAGGSARAALTTWGIDDILKPIESASRAAAVDVMLLAMMRFALEAEALMECVETDVKAYAVSCLLSSRQH
jgi:hypothetical protein